MDLFENEQLVYDQAVCRIEDVRNNGISFDFEEYPKLAREYGRLLKQLRKTNHRADRLANDLHVNNVDLTGKVNYDALTGIYNRRYMENRIKEIMSAIARTSSGGCLSVMMLDVDNFKKYNDTYGHAMGDVCLKTIAEILKGSVTRAADFAARYGGEEFIIVLPNTEKDGACKIAKTILEGVTAKNIPHEKNRPGIVTVSIGVTSGCLERTLCADDYIKRADEALYMSKQNGRNTYTYVNFKEHL